MSLATPDQPGAAELLQAESPPDRLGTSLKSLAIRGAIWTVGGYGLSQALRLGSNLILTRLLFPEAFGLMALVTVVLQGLQMFSDVGVAPSIIQNKRGEEPDFLNTAWTIQVIRGFLLWLACCALAWPVSTFYEQPLLAWILVVSGMTAAIGGFNSTALILANRRLALGRVTLLELGTQIFGIATMLVWALVQPTVWALVAGGLVSVTIKAGLSHVLLRGIRCRFRWEPNAARSLFRFGRWIFLSTVLTFLVTQGDRLVFGKVLAIDLLGVYSIAVMISMFPTELVSRLANAVVFPSYSNVVQRGRDLSTVFHKARLPLAAAGGLLTAILVACSPWLVAALYDDRYSQAGWMLQILATGIVFRVLECSNGCALLATGKSAAIAAGSAAKLSGMAICIPLGWWLNGFAGALIGLVVSEAIKYGVSATMTTMLGLRVAARDALLLTGVGLTSLLGYLSGYALDSRVELHPAITALVAASVAALGWLPMLRVAVRSLLPR